MILNNYWKWLKGCTEYDPTSEADINYGIITETGDNTALCLTGSGNWAKFRMFDTAHTYVKIGTGEVDEDENSYTMSNNITPSFTNLSHVISQSVDPSGLKKIITITGTNSTSSEVEITKIAIGKQLADNTEGRYGRYKNVLLAIAELDSPLTVRSLDTFTVTFEWTEA